MARLQPVGLRVTAMRRSAHIEDVQVGRRCLAGGVIRYQVDDEGQSLCVIVEVLLRAIVKPWFAIEQVDNLLPPSLALQAVALKSGDLWA
jgi:hypothetical protein